MSSEQGSDPDMQRDIARVCGALRIHLLKHGIRLNDDAIEDIVGDTLVKAVENLAEFNPRKSTFAGWIYKRACYEALTFMKRRAGLREVHADLHLFQAECEHSRETEGDPPPSTPEWSTEADRLLEILQGLKHIDREIILCYSENFDAVGGVKNTNRWTAELATKIGKSPKYIRGRFIRVRSYIAKMMDRHNPAAQERTKGHGNAS